MGARKTGKISDETGSYADCVRHHALAAHWRFPGLFANSAEVARCPGLTGAPETAHLRLGDDFGGLSLAAKSRFPETETAEGRDLVRMRRLLRRKAEHLVLARPFSPPVVPAHLDATATAAGRFFERRFSVITRAFGSPKMPCTVGRGRKPGNAYVSHRRRFRFAVRAIHIE